MTRTVESECPRTAVTAGGWPILCERTDVAQRTCSVDGCEQPHEARGWCIKHYACWYRTGSPFPKERPTFETCTVEGCARVVRNPRSPLCDLHYNRLFRHGSTDVPSFVCIRCSGTFPRSKGRQYLCPPCAQESAREHGRAKYRREPASYIRRASQWRSKNPERARELARLAQRRKTPEERYEQGRRNREKYPDFWRAKTREGARRRRARLRQVRVEPYRDADVFDRDDWCCGLCGKPIDSSLQWPDPWCATIDHVVPISHGGADALDNVQAAHFRCNGSKHNRMVV